MPRKKKVQEAKTAIVPEINIGLVGHVDHGKTTLVKAFSGKWTDTHSEELKRGITIKLGYADAIFYKCPKCSAPECYSINKVCPVCGAETQILRKVSFVDAPGHESLMATMLAGATIIDGALLLVSALEDCPQPQTREHLTALEIVGIKNLIVVQNKVDVVDEKKATENYNQIREFLKTTVYKDVPIIPVSAMHSINLDILIQQIQEIMPTPKRELSKEPVMLVARSFDINKPGKSPDNLVGGVLGGALKQGTLSLNQEIEICPGYPVEEKNKKIWKPIKTKIAGLMTGGESVSEVTPGGSIALLTELDPSIVKSDKLVGNIVGIPGKLPPVLYSLTLKVFLLERVVGAKEETKVEPIKMNEALMLNVNSAATVGFVTELGRDIIKCNLKIPVCANKTDRITISRRVGNRFRLIGYGTISG